MLFRSCPNSDNPALLDSEKIFPRILSYLSDAFSWNNCVFSIPKDRESASRIVIRNELSVVHSLTIETSFGGISSGPRSGLLYNEIIWKELGEKCCEGTYHLLCGEDSPYMSYVTKELTYLNTPPPPERRYDWVPKRIITEDHSDQYLEINSGLSGIVHLEQPAKKFCFDASSISEEMPNALSPKWEKLEYKM